MPQPIPPACTAHRRDRERRGEKDQNMQDKRVKANIMLEKNRKKLKDLEKL